MNFSYKTRKKTIDGLKNTDLDLLIIGGGITGAGVAIQAAKAGAKVGLLEMQDFAEAPWFWDLFPSVFQRLLRRWFQSQQLTLSRPDHRNS